MKVRSEIALFAMQHDKSSPLPAVRPNCSRKLS
jgi:hypothetical protein